MSTDEAPRKALRVNDAHYVHQTVDGEVLIIDIETGTYFSLRGAAAAVWPLLVAGQTAEDVVAAAAAAFDRPEASVQSDLVPALDRLLKEGILEIGGSPAPGPVLHNLAFEPTTFERFDDMRDLLTLDPIHGVTDAGWPHTDKPR